VYPTKKQMDIICRFADYYRGNVCIDISDERGNIVKTFEYPEKTSSSRIIFDIRTVFQQRKIFAESV
jgi:hypothetical protein